MKQINNSELAIYQVSKNEAAIEVRLEKETIWLTKAQIALIFQTDRTVITRHLNNIFKTGELDEKSNVQKMHIPKSDKPVKFYNIDTVISVGYRVNSKREYCFSK